MGHSCKWWDDIIGGFNVCAASIRETSGVLGSYHAAMGLPGEPVAPTSLSGAQVKRNS